MPVDDPTDLSRRDYKAALKATFKEMKGDDVPSLAAAVAFRIFLSLFPSLLAAAAIFGLVTTPSEIVNLLEGLRGGVLPPAAVELLETPLRNLSTQQEGTAGTLAVAGVLGGIWAATTAAVGLMKALSRAYDVEETRKFVKQRLVALALTAALFLGIVAMILLLVAGPQIQDALLPRNALGSGLGVLFLIARVAVALLVLVVLFAFVYYLGPNRDQPSWQWVSPGAVLGVVGWLALSAAFTLYVQTSGKYNETYGAIAGVIVLLVWLQLTMTVLLIGAELNAELERQAQIARNTRAGAGFGLAEPGLHTAEPAAIASATWADANAERSVAPVLAAPPPQREQVVVQRANVSGGAVGAVFAGLAGLAFLVGRLRRHG
jgi:membrane protein